MFKGKLFPFRLVFWRRDTTVIKNHGPWGERERARAPPLSAHIFSSLQVISLKRRLRGENDSIGCSAALMSSPNRKISQVFCEWSI